MRTNYPGEDKLEPLATKIADIAAKEMKNYFREDSLQKSIRKP